MARIVYPGSFDPITVGHIDIIQRLIEIFDEVVLLVAKSTRKHSLFTADERVSLIEKALFSRLNGKKLSVQTFEGLTVDFMRKNQINVIVRGLRAVSDYEYELSMAQMNKKLYPECETFFLQADAQLTFISSRGIKEVALNGGSLEGLLPKEIHADVLEKLKTIKE